MVPSLAPAVTPPDARQWQRLETPVAGYWHVASPVSVAAGVPWLKATSLEGARPPIELGRQVIVQLAAGADLAAALADSPAVRARKVNDQLVLLEMPDAQAALREAARLRQMPGVMHAQPESRRPLQKAVYSPRPSDTYFNRQWHLENRNTNDYSAGPDFNARAAWPVSRGQGVMIAVVDDGVELTHPELAGRVAGSPHYNFDLYVTNGGPAGVNANHSTAVAGWAVAEGNNARGVSGLAPAARLASLVIFGADDSSVGESAMMDMFQHQPQTIAIQNHSWTSSEGYLSGPGLLELAAIGNAITNGRGGRGIIMVRASGNGRAYGDNANDDGFISDPRVIAVSAARKDGAATSYANPGACVLVAGLAGDDGFDASLTTDRQGDLGYTTGTNDLADYTDDFTGTSATTPQISGLAALLLAANTNLTIRDVQQILLLSARHYHLADPYLQTNGAGLRVSPTLGFGIPDAGHAVQLARHWSNRPAAVQTHQTNTTASAISDASARVVVTGDNVPAALASIAAVPSVLGVRPDKPTADLPLVFVGLATNALSTNLTGKAALIQRGVAFFEDKIRFAGQAGAAYAIIFDNIDEPNLILMDVADDIPIPTFFISKANGEALRDFIQTNNTALARLQLGGTTRSFYVPNSRLCEHVGVRIKTDHPLRGDLRISLISPAGTVSVLQGAGSDLEAGPEDWTYYSTQHFYENSLGFWTVQVSDEHTNNFGNLQYAELIVDGVPMNDANQTGLDDQWELERLHAAAADPRADPDGDGYSNLLEYILGTDPLAPNAPLKVELSAYEPGLLRLEWPSSAAFNYQVFGGAQLGQPLALVTNRPGGFPVTEWFVPITNSFRFFQIKTGN